MRQKRQRSVTRSSHCYLWVSYPGQGEYTLQKENVSNGRTAIACACRVESNKLKRLSWNIFIRHIHFTHLCRELVFTYFSWSAIMSPSSALYDVVLLWLWLMNTLVSCSRSRNFLRHQKNGRKSSNWFPSKKYTYKWLHLYWTHTSSC